MSSSVINLTNFLRDVKHYCSIPITQPTNGVFPSILFMAYLGDRIISLNSQKWLNIHRWKGATPESELPFLFSPEIDSRGVPIEKRHVDINFASGLDVGSHQFDVSSNQR